MIMRIYAHLTISIHAPRTGSDGEKLFSRHVRHISIHAPRTGSDACVSISELS